MTPSEREEIERYAQPVFNHNGWNTDGEPFKLTEVPLIKLPDGKYVLYSDHLTQVEKARREEREKIAVYLEGTETWEGREFAKTIRNKPTNKGE